VIVRVHAQPGARRAGIAGIHGGALKIRIRARPVEGAANRELVATVARAFGVRPAAVTVETGAGGRAKRLRVDGLDVRTASARLAAFVDKGGGAD
jgi:uncharacterized protein